MSRIRSEESVSVRYRLHPLPNMVDVWCCYRWIESIGHERLNPDFAIRNRFSSIRGQNETRLNLPNLADKYKTKEDGDGGPKRKWHKRFKRQRKSQNLGGVRELARELEATYDCRPDFMTPSPTSALILRRETGWEMCTNVQRAVLDVGCQHPSRLARESL